METASQFISMWWPVPAVLFMFCMVAFTIIDAVEKRWPRSQRRRLRKEMLPVVIRLRELRNRERLDRKFHELRTEAKESRRRLRLLEKLRRLERQVAR